jgi:hypothetical protein
MERSLKKTFTRRNKNKLQLDTNLNQSVSYLGWLLPLDSTQL